MVNYKDLGLVNTKELFAKYPTLQSFADADADDIAEIVKPCGLY